MDKLNELEILAKAVVKNVQCRSYPIEQFLDAATPESILAIAKAFRDLEQRAEAAESALELSVYRQRATQAEQAAAELRTQLKQKTDYKWFVELVRRHLGQSGEVRPQQLAHQVKQLKEARGSIGMSTATAGSSSAIHQTGETGAVPMDLVPDYFDRLVVDARARAEKAMRKFPQPNYVLNKVAEESGEVIKAVIHYTEGREDWLSVEGELIDNLAMLIRLVTEGDGVIGFSPPEEVLRRIEGLK